MSYLVCDVIWKVKDEVNLPHDNVTSFLVGGFTFTHKSGNHISFDFYDFNGDYDEDRRIFDFECKGLDEDFVNESLLMDGYADLIKEEHDISFFEEGKIMLSDNSVDEICVTMDINGEEVNERSYIKPAFLRIREPETSKEVILFNELTNGEFIEYYGR